MPFISLSGYPCIEMVRDYRDARSLRCETVVAVGLGLL